MRFDEFLQGDVAPHRLPSSWVTNTKFVFQNDEGGLAIFDTANDSVSLLVTNHTMVSLIDLFAFFMLIIHVMLQLLLPNHMHKKLEEEWQDNKKVALMVFIPF